ncbi:hypothetical protein [Longispora albida]|uniref:hypothetical protein n=1 Tax=Longispora albida TaxID=203523 RepID=UPI0003702827|nr:hypothetical protein [Longispora albida]
MTDYEILIDHGGPGDADVTVECDADHGFDLTVGLLRAVLRADPSIRRFVLEVDGQRIGVVHAELLDDDTDGTWHRTADGAADGREELPGLTASFRPVAFTCPESGCPRLTYRGHANVRPPSCPVHGVPMEGRQ